MESDVANTDDESDLDRRCDELRRQIDAGRCPSVRQIAYALNLPPSHVEAEVALATIAFFRKSLAQSGR
jgi:hypothetical protein